jgi:hypothetical protein
MLTWRKGSGEQETLKFDRRAEDMEKTRQNTQGINGCDVNVKKISLSIVSRKGLLLDQKLKSKRGKTGLFRWLTTPHQLNPLVNGPT